MRKFIFIVLLLAASQMFGQGVRFGDQAPIQSTISIPGSGTVLVPKQATIQFCNSPANAVPCTNKATTYTDGTLGTSCATSTQVTLAGSSSCVAQTDSLGNWGVWVKPAPYQWTYTVGGLAFGPFNAYVQVSPPISTIPLPTASTANGQIYIITNGSTAGDCTVGGGSSRSLCWSNGTVWASVGDGGGVNLIASGTATLNPGAISSATCAPVVTVSAPGVATTDSIIATFNADPTSTTGFIPSTSGMLTIISYPSANNVNFKECNNTNASVTPGSVTLNWRVPR